jgi:hypothetical protein
MLEHEPRASEHADAEGMVVRCLVVRPWLCVACVLRQVPLLIRMQEDERALMKAAPPFASTCNRHVQHATCNM